MAGSTALAARLRRWFRENGRAFPWRDSHDPYEILVGEILLQRTRADIVAGTYKDFIARFPTPAALAKAELADIATVVGRLGLTKRQPLLPALGAALVERHGGAVPSSREELLKLPLVGPYVASAVRCMAFGKPDPMIDRGVIRLVRRLLGVEEGSSRPHQDTLVWATVTGILGRRPREVNLALIDLSAAVCRPKPRCDECPVATLCGSRRA